MSSFASASSSSYLALHSGFTVMRRLGVSITSPLAMCQRMDGRLGLFTEKSVPFITTDIVNPRDDNSNVILAIPLTSTLHRFQRCFKPSPQNWRYAADIASTCNFPTYFEMTSLDLDSVDDDNNQSVANSNSNSNQSQNQHPQRTVDEQQARLQRCSSILQERKWLEGSAALFTASAVVLAERQRKLERFLPSANLSDRAVIEYIAWAFDNNFPGFQVELDEKGQNAPKSMQDVEARYHIMQACSHLEASLMDAITTCELGHAQRLFGERAEAPQTFTDVVSQAVETTVFGGVFGVPFRSRREIFLRQKHAVNVANVTTNFQSFVTGIDTRYCTPLFFYAPYLSNISTAVDPFEANCVIDRFGDRLLLKLLRPLRAGEELVKLEPHLV